MFMRIRPAKSMRPGIAKSLAVAACAAVAGGLAAAANQVVAPSAVAVAKSRLCYIDPLIGTEGSGSQYGGMQPYTCVPFGSFHMVPMTRLNRVGQLSFNAADDTLIGFILTRQPAIWMGDWGEVRIPIEPSKIERAEYAPHLGRVTAGGRMFEYTATAHAAWLRGDMMPQMVAKKGGVICCLGSVTGFEGEGA